MNTLFFVIGGFVGVVAGGIGMALVLLPAYEQALQVALRYKQEKDAMLDWSDPCMRQIQTYKRKVKVNV
jgi:hypothetical protein